MVLKCHNYFAQSLEKEIIIYLKDILLHPLRKKFTYLNIFGVYLCESES